MTGALKCNARRACLQWPHALQGLRLKHEASGDCSTIALAIHFARTHQIPRSRHPSPRHELQIPSQARSLPVRHPRPLAAQTLSSTLYCDGGKMIPKMSVRKTAQQLKPSLQDILQRDLSEALKMVLTCFVTGR